MYRVLFIVVFLEWVSYGLIIPCIPFFGKALDVNSFQLGILNSAFALSALIFAPIIGWLSDFISKKSIICFCLLISIISMEIASFSNTYSLFIISRILAGIGASNIAVIYAYISLNTLGSQRINQLGKVSSAMALGLVLGPLINSLLIGKQTIIGALKLNFSFSAIILSIAFLICLFFLKKDKLSQPIEKLKINLVINNILKSDNKITLFIIGGISFSMSSLLIYFPIWTNENHLWGPSENAIAISIICLIIAVFQGVFLPVLSKYFTPKNLLIVSISFLLTSNIVFLVANSNTLLLIGLIFFGIGFGISSPVLTSFISMENQKGTFLSISESVKNFSEFIGPISIGILIEISNLNALFYSLFFLIMVCLFSSLKIKTYIYE
jgi:DHA1 family tetracycline resistance protein-like MFS transporter